MHRRSSSVPSRLTAPTGAVIDARVGFVSIILAILAVGVLIIVHEAGHYYAAVWSGMRVSRFSVGFGPVIYRTQRGETEFALSAVPLGGYVQIDGMSPEDGTDPDDPRAYQSRPFFAKFGTVLAGPVANYALGFLLFFLFFAFFYARPAPPVRIVDVVAGQAAEAAGIRAGDVIVGANGEAFESVDDLSRVVDASDGGPVVFQVRRDEALQDIAVEPRPAAGTYLIGVRFEGTSRVRDPQGVVAGAGLAAKALVQESWGMLMGLSMLVTRTVGLDAVDGPIGIVKGLADQVERSSAGALAFVAKLSVVLGLFNLLPIPALDGARLMFLTVGAIRRRPVEPRLESWVHLAGFALLFGLLLVVSLGDLFE
jgi:regulator of sigma E protease